MARKMPSDASIIRKAIVKKTAEFNKAMLHQVDIPSYEKMGEVAAERMKLGKPMAGPGYVKDWSEGVGSAVESPRTWRRAQNVGDVVKESVRRGLKRAVKLGNISAMDVIPVTKEQVQKVGQRAKVIAGKKRGTVT